jgi:predicted SprT family Zn-dependent metalloprotease
MTLREELIREWKIQKAKWELSEWELKFSNQKRHLGCCSPRKKIISVSRAFMQINPFSVMKDTLLHEIAHALHYIETGKTNHNNNWKKFALKVGCEPKRCATGEGLNMPKGNYIGVCPVCGKETHFYRRVRRSYSCSHCTSSYDPRFKLTIMSRQEYNSNYNRKIILND